MSAVIPYAVLNNAINRVFFDGRFAGLPVYLSLDQEMHEELAGILGIEEDGLENVICASVGRHLKQRGNPYEGMLVELHGWERNGMVPPPPFTAVLFTLAHAAAIMAAEGNFGPNNYYLRLAQVTQLERQVLSFHGRWTEELWNGLNLWLLDNNYELGKPTARAINAWRYVGMAMSQAIVRAGDRVLFHDMFERHGLSGNEGVSTQEMRHYLAHWMTTSRPNNRLRNAWNNEDLRDRVCEAAIAELASWSSGTAKLGSTASGQKATKLSLLANLVAKFPGQVLELHLGRNGDDDPRGPFKLEGSEATFYLANDRYGGFLTVSPPPFGVGAEGLSQSFSFEADGSGQGLEWRPRLLIPLAKSAQGPAWVEVSRVAFGVEHMLLVRDTRNLPAEVEAFLMGAAMAEPKTAQHSDIPGIPEGWVLYQGVKVRSSPVQPSRDLECLVPLGEEGTLSVAGGMQLQSSFYHPGTPMTASLVAPKGPVRLEALMPGAGANAQACGPGEQCSLEIDAKIFPNCDAVTITGWQGEKEVGSRELFFRDADRPNRLGAERSGRLSYRAITSASDTGGDEPVFFVQGMCVVGELDVSAAPSQVTQGTRPPSGSMEEPRPSPLAGAISRHVSKQTCIGRGYHIWRFPPVPPNTAGGTPIEGICSDCQQGLICIYRGRSHVAHDQRPARLPLQRISLQQENGGTPIDHDQLLDALCFLGTGSWGKFEALLETWPGGTDYPRQVIENLFLLGFLDLQVRTGTNSVRSWSVPPPLLNFTGEATAYLSGFRSNGLLGKLAKAVEQIGGTFHLDDIPGRPRMAWIEGIDATAAARALSTIRDPLDREVVVQGEAALRLAKACNMLGGIEDATIPVSIGRPAELKKFNLQTAKWQDVGSLSGPGAYHWNSGMSAYAHVPVEGEPSLGAHHVVKLLAARDAGVRLHAFEPQSSTFVATLGSEPPGLLARALVACSGRLPEIGHGILSYSSITSDIAGLILNKLYPRGD